MGDPTLHDELRDILRARGNAWTSLVELAKEVKSRGRYHKRDGSEVEPSQVHLRTRSGGAYDDVFERNGSLVRLRLFEGANLMERIPAVQAQRETSAPADSSSRLIDAKRALAGPRIKIEDAESTVPPIPGLYAVYGDPPAWQELGLGVPPDDRPIYVGKAERSLAGRDMRQHFSNGQTGSSTLRRSIAAQLHDSFGLAGLPRNPVKPDHFDRYGMSPADDQKVTAWMRLRLTIAVWPSDEDRLAALEAEVLRAQSPPLNLTLMTTPWTREVRRNRAVMASEARSWAGFRDR